MSYGVEFEEPAEIDYYSWGLPLAAYEQIEQLLTEELSMEPTRYLRRIGSPTRAMQYVCRVIEQSPAPVVHVCFFRVRYSQDEETLIIWDCWHFTLRA